MHAFQASAATQEKIMEILGNYGVGRIDDIPGSSLVQLRWVHHPILGFPRQPFKVWSIPHQDFRYQDLIEVINLMEVRQNSFIQTVDWTSQLADPRMYEVRMEARLFSGSFLRILAIDTSFNPIPGQELIFDFRDRELPRIGENIPCCFRAPGIIGLKVIGFRSSVRSIKGLSVQDLINSNSWKEVQRVGLPYFSGELNPPAYDNSPQGYLPNLLEGNEAARLRLELAASVTDQLPNPSGNPINWAPLDLSIYQDSIRKHNLQLITNCLENTKDEDISNLQSQYFEEFQVPGIRQDQDGAQAQDVADISVEVVSNTMMSVYGDSFFACGTGHGTMEFMRVRRKKRCVAPPGTLLDGFLMITNTFVLPSFLGPIKLELATLPQSMPIPPAVKNLGTKTQSHNRPAERDGHGSASVQLSWDWPPKEITLSYFIGGLIDNSEFSILNTKRKNDPGGFEPFLAARPSQSDLASDSTITIDDSQVFYTDTKVPIPLRDSKLNRFFVLATDWFGRLSDWRQSTYEAKAFPPQRPLVNSVQFILTNEETGGPLFDASLEIEFSWDWIDRSPDKIEFRGLFLPAFNAAPPVEAPDGFEIDNQHGTNPGPLIVSFDPATRRPAITSGHSGEVISKDPDPGPEAPDSFSEIKRYTLVVSGGQVEGGNVRPILLNFNDTDRLSFAVYVRGYEKVQPDTPAITDVNPNPSIVVEKAYIAEAVDPTPPPPPEGFNAVINWTALPDATGKARAKIEWDPSPGVKGYNIWQASETALLHFIEDEVVPDPVPDTSLTIRGNILRARLEGDILNEDFEILPGEDAERKENNKLNSLQAFAKVNSELIRKNSFEIEIPATSDNIFAFRISALKSNNKESEKSKAVFYAVPHRNEPGPPILVLRPSRNENPGVWILAAPSDNQVIRGYRIFRVRKHILTTEIGRMGPPKVKEDHEDWIPFQDILDRPDLSYLHAVINSLIREERRARDLNPDEQTNVQLYGRAFFDPVAISWFPYHYRVQAIGFEDLSLGEIGGISSPSVVQRTFLLPKEPPVLTGVEVKSGGQLIKKSAIPTSRPVALEPHPNRPWILAENYNDNAISIFEITENAQNLIQTITIGRKIRQFSINQHNDQLIVASGGNLLFLDAENNKLIHNLLLKRPISTFSISPLNNEILVSFQNAGHFIVINGNNFQQERRVNTFPRQTFLTIHQSLGKLYTAGPFSKTIKVFDLTTFELLEDLSLEFIPGEILVDDSFQKIMVENRRGRSIYVFDEAFQNVNEIKLRGRQRDAFFSENGLLYIVTSFRQLLAIDREDGVVKFRLPLNSNIFDVIVKEEKIFLSNYYRNTIDIMQFDKHNAVFLFTTDLPVRTTPKGSARIDLTALELNPDTGRYQRLQPILSFDPVAVEEGALLKPFFSNSEMTLPAEAEMSRTAPDDARLVTYSIRLDTADLKDKRLAVTVTDPDNRVHEEQFQKYHNESY